jgi:hypothetical protein
MLWSAGEGYSQRGVFRPFEGLRGQDIDRCHRSFSIDAKFGLHRGAVGTSEVRKNADKRGNSSLDLWPVQAGWVEDASPAKSRRSLGSQLSLATCVTAPEKISTTPQF